VRPRNYIHKKLSYKVFKLHHPHEQDNEFWV